MNFRIFFSPVSAKNAVGILVESARLSQFVEHVIFLSQGHEFKPHVGPRPYFKKKC